MTDEIKVWINVTQVADDEDLDEDDRDAEIPGRYLATLPASAALLSRAGQASAALDVFHGSIGISVLDHFGIEAVEEDGSAIDLGDDDAPYSWDSGGDVYKLSDDIEA
jgi:hypothetical protein